MMRKGMAAGALCAVVVWAGLAFGQAAAGQPAGQPTPSSPTPSSPGSGAPASEPAAAASDTAPAAQPTEAAAPVATSEPKSAPVVERTSTRDEVEEPPAPPPPIKDDATEYFHDGLYLRLSLGLSHLNADGQIDPGAIDFKLEGAGVGLDVMVGGTPTPGLAVGGAYWFNQSPSPDFEFAGTTSSVNADLNFGMLGIFVDGFPAPDGGFHLGGTVGFAVATVGTDGNTNEGGDRGFGAGAFLGYDAWVAKQWALGCLLRASYAGLSNTEEDLDETLKVVNVALMFTALHH